MIRASLALASLLCALSVSAPAVALDASIDNLCRGDNAATHKAYCAIIVNTQSAGTQSAAGGQGNNGCSEGYRDPDGASPAPCAILQ